MLLRDTKDCIVQFGPSVCHVTSPFLWTLRDRNTTVGNDRRKTQAGDERDQRRTEYGRPEPARRPQARTGQSWTTNSNAADQMTALWLFRVRVRLSELIESWNMRVMWQYWQFQNKKSRNVPGYPVINSYPGCPVSLYPGLQTHSNDSGRSTQTCVVILQSCRPLRHSFSRGHRVDAHTFNRWVAFLPSHVLRKGPLRGKQSNTSK